MCVNVFVCVVIVCVCVCPEKRDWLSGGCGSGPDFLPCPSWLVGFDLVDWFCCFCNTHAFFVCPEFCFLSAFPDVVCGVVGTF